MTTSSDAIARRFGRLRENDRRALVCYVTAGHPEYESCIELLHGVQEAGADIIEVGVPFSDPLADGPVIQASSQRALQGGMTFDGALELIAHAKLRIPVVLFSYLNPVLSAGSDALERAADAGAHGILITDLPLGADPARESWLGGGPLAFVRLVAPTTPADRMGAIARNGGGFVYLISRLGVTGARSQLPPDLNVAVERLRGVSPLPVCVGFGISTPGQAAEVARIADGVVVGSALVSAAERGVEYAAGFTADLRHAIDAG